MKNKIPLPVAVAVVIVIVALAGFVIFRSAGTTAASGDVTAQANEVLQANPKNAPKLPPGIDPTKGALSFGSKTRAGTPAGAQAPAPAGPKGAQAAGAD